MYVAYTNVLHIDNVNKQRFKFEKHEIDSCLNLIHVNSLALKTQNLMYFCVSQHNNSGATYIFRNIIEVQVPLMNIYLGFYQHKNFLSLP